MTTATGCVNGLENQVCYANPMTHEPQSIKPSNDVFQQGFYLRFTHEPVIRYVRQLITTVDFHNRFFDLSLCVKLAAVNNAVYNVDYKRIILVFLWFSF